LIRLSIAKLLSLRKIALCSILFALCISITGITPCAGHARLKTASNPIQLSLLKDWTVAIQEESDLLGDWSGESICQDRASACHDEKNVYHISKSKKPGVLTVSADRIVDGKAVNMGDIEFRYNRDNKTLTSESDRAVWKFVVNGKTMEGTLTLMPDKKVFRRVTLKKD